MSFFAFFSLYSFLFANEMNVQLLFQPHYLQIECRSSLPDILAHRLTPIEFYLRGTNTTLRNQTRGKQEKQKKKKKKGRQKKHDREIQRQPKWKTEPSIRFDKERSINQRKNMEVKEMVQKKANRFNVEDIEGLKKTTKRNSLEDKKKSETWEHEKKKQQKKIRIAREGLQL